MSAQLMTAFLLFAVSISMTPGAGNIALIGLSSRYGVSATLPFIVGNAVGVIAILTGASVGLAGLLALYPTLYLALKWLGAAYLLYMAWGIANMDLDNNASVKKSGFLSGIMVQILNPKGWVASITVFSQFVSPASNYVVQVVFIIGVMVITGVIGMLIWAYFGSMLTRFIESPRKMVAINRSFGASLAAVAIFLVIQPS
ncbi:LysE family translocator [Vibrio neptunius]|uniref:LysE family translocator n=1 Tax=Vibrio neptunius TaxID=170651 RepID=A0ABS3A206_9VIBR|nr:LysE family translocator [Vibrio neptunius]MBN3492454.1 LysE family translocator [Vibrio neptunius]MBN3514951.1 LysE family translocator [Vibrio neptunius]MBN3548789.1 LysE family translocator [Vibrio neptunius]MBN3577079.1 LysE family translocator [Vibrio neptunius]MCH9870744.1 LysE family translocator [Vibrio neptunius]